MPEQILLVLCTAPNDGTAERLADLLVSERLAACVNITQPIKSVFRWDNKIDHEQESLLVIKSTATRYPELEQKLKKEHPYELPEIIALPIQQGLSDYLQWVEENTCEN